MNGLINGPKVLRSVALVHSSLEAMAVVDRQLQAEVREGATEPQHSQLQLKPEDFLHTPRRSREHSHHCKVQQRGSLDTDEQPRESWNNTCSALYTCDRRPGCHSTQSPCWAAGGTSLACSHVEAFHSHCLAVNTADRKAVGAVVADPLTLLVLESGREKGAERSDEKGYRDRQRIVPRTEREPEPRLYSQFYL